jgi:hypothetical protein
VQLPFAVSPHSLDTIPQTSANGLHVFPQVSAAVVTSGEAWYNEAKKFPVKSIKKTEVLVAGRNNVLIYFQFDKVGNARYNIAGFVLLRISEDKKVWEALIEFDSIAWGVNTGQINQYCPKCPKAVF